MRCAGTLTQYTRPHRQVTGTRMSARAETGPHCRCVRLTCPVLSSRCILCTDPHLGGVTMLRRVSVLALTLIIAACGDDEPDVLDPQDLRILIVRGDGQVSEVAPAGPSADVVMSVRYANTPDPSTVLPDTLVARITG